VKVRGNNVGLQHCLVCMYHIYSLIYFYQGSVHSMHLVLLAAILCVLSAKSSVLPPWHAFQVCMPVTCHSGSPLGGPTDDGFGLSQLLCLVDRDRLCLNQNSLCVLSLSPEVSESSMVFWLVGELWPSSAAL